MHAALAFIFLTGWDVSLFLCTARMKRDAVTRVWEVGEALALWYELVVADEIRYMSEM